MPKASHGYGGKFGVQEDRMDKVGLWDSEVCAFVRPSVEAHTGSSPGLGREREEFSHNALSSTALFARSAGSAAPPLF